jgi:hypothetical protein
MYDFNYNASFYHCKILTCMTESLPLCSRFSMTEYDQFQLYFSLICNEKTFSFSTVRILKTAEVFNGMYVYRFYQ